MGTLYYEGSATPIHIDDLALAHLKVVIATKFRRSESFTLTWRHPDDQTPGHSTIWLHPSIPLRFVFENPEPVTLNQRWLLDLAGAANSSAGIALAAEHLIAAAQTPDSAEECSSTLPAVLIDEVSITTLRVRDADLPESGTQG